MLTSGLKCPHTGMHIRAQTAMCTQGHIHTHRAHTHIHTQSTRIHTYTHREHTHTHTEPPTRTDLKMQSFHLKARFLQESSNATQILRVCQMLAPELGLFLPLTIQTLLQVRGRCAPVSKGLPHFRKPKKDPKQKTSLLGEGKTGKTTSDATCTPPILNTNTQSCKDFNYFFK